MRRVDAQTGTLQRRIRLMVLLLMICGFGCTDPCTRLLETMCKDMPHEQYCRSYREKVSAGDISPEMCRATRRAYVGSLAEGRKR